MVGAGPSGLAAAIALRQRGLPVVVHERAGRVGERFGGDFQGIENWTGSGDALRELSEMGIAPDRLPTRGFREVELWVAGRGPFRVRAREPIFYLVRRGPGPGTLDTALLELAVASGADVRLRDPATHAPWKDALVAVGPHAADMIAEGLTFPWDGPDLAVAVVDADLAPGGYAYLLRHGGRATLATVLWRDFASIHERLERTQAWLASHYGCAPESPRRFGGFGNFSLDLPAVEGDRLYLGEAAGLQDYLWGFGMRFAFRSAALAARAVWTRPDPARTYAAAVERRLRPLQRVSLANRVIFEALERRAALPWLCARLAKKDPRRVLHRLFAPGPARHGLGRALAARHRSALRDRRCHLEGCTCVWCRCARGTTGHQGLRAGEDVRVAAPGHPQLPASS